MNLSILETIWSKNKPTPPANSQDRWLDVRGGLLRVRLSGDSKNPAVILIPDPPNTLEHQQNLIKNLAVDHYVVAFEAPGFGYSKAKVGFQYSLDEMSDVILNVIENLGCRDVTLALTCVSVFPGLLAAQRRPDLIRHLLAAQAPSLEEEVKWVRRIDFKGIMGIPWLGQLFIGAAKSLIAKKWYERALPNGSASEPYFSIAKASFQNGACFCLASALQAFAKEPVSRDLRVEQRSVVLWGLADRSHRITDKRSILKYLPNAEYVEIPNCGHFPDLEFHEEFARQIRVLRGGLKK